jgi:hypothetical protein
MKRGVPMNELLGERLARAVDELDEPRHEKPVGLEHLLTSRHEWM